MILTVRAWSDPSIFGPAPANVAERAMSNARGYMSDDMSALLLGDPILTNNYQGQARVLWRCRHPYTLPVLRWFAPRAWDHDWLYRVEVTSGPDSLYGGWKEDRVYVGYTYGPGWGWTGRPRFRESCYRFMAKTVSVGEICLLALKIGLCVFGLWLLAFHFRVAVWGFFAVSLSRVWVSKWPRALNCLLIAGVQLVWLMFWLWLSARISAEFAREARSPW
jgi:hypothetical protein